MIKLNLVFSFVGGGRVHEFHHGLSDLDSDVSSYQGSISMDLLTTSNLTFTVEKNSALAGLYPLKLTLFSSSSNGKSQP